ncbi:hypothetical protein FACS1894102_5280 [Spirochaetia bacterium]|nr:hypothetical protein FACS1894102_5280 [Spirochaetia bacterium]
MKRLAFLFLIFLITVEAIFSLEFNFSVGAGLHTGVDFNSLTATIKGGEYHQKRTQANIGGLLFFDATYVEADILVLGTSTTFTHNPRLFSSTGIYADWELGGVNIGLGLLGKFPIVINDEWTIFPLLGFQYDISVSQNFSKDYPYESDGSEYWAKEGANYGNSFDWSSFSLKAGLGADYSFAESYYVRAELLYDFRFNSAIDNGYINRITQTETVEDISNLTMGFSVKILAGIRLGSVATSTAPRKQSRQPRRTTTRDDDLYYPK